MNRERLVELCRRAREGDEAAIHEIVVAVAGPLHGYLRTIVKDHHLAEEIAQDALVKALQNLDRLRNVERFPTWLFSIGRFLALDRRRREARAAPRKTEVDWDAFDRVDVLDDDETPARLEDIRSAFLTALERLPEEQREVLNRRYRLSMSYDDLADSLGLTRAQVKGRLSRAREKLRAQVRRLVPDWKRLIENVSRDP